MLAACGMREQPAPISMAGGPGAAVGTVPSGGALGIPTGIDKSQLGPGSQSNLSATAGDRVFFAYDRSELSAEGQETLRRQSEWLRRYPNVSVTIEGHADERGTREYNLSLGERRAQTVRNALVALGTPVSRISIISYGKERPEVPHSDESSYAQNRRAVTVVN